MAVASGATLLRHTVLYLSGRLATGAVGLLTLAAFTRVLSPTDYGRYTVIIAIVSLIAGVGFQWLRQGLVRFGTGESAKPAALLGTMGVLFAALIGVMTVVAAAIAIERFDLGISSPELAVICGLAVTQAWFELATDAARTEFRPWRYSAATFIRAALSLVLGVAAALLTHQVVLVVVGIALGYLLSSFVAAPRWLVGLLHLGSATMEQAKGLLGYGLPLAGTLGMTFILDTADRLMLAGMHGYAEAGVYASSYNLAQFSIGTALSGLSLGALPLAVSTFRSGDLKRAKALLDRNLLLGFAICLPAVAGLAVTAPVLDRLLLGNYVSGRSDVVTIIIAFATGLAALRAYCVDVVFMLHRRTWVQGLIIASSALFNVGLNFFTIPRWGATGAAAASLAAYLIAMVGSAFLSTRFLQLSISISDATKIAAATVVMAGIVYIVLRAQGQWVNLFCAILAGAVTYALTVLALNAAGSRQIVSSLFSQLGIQRSFHVK